MLILAKPSLLFSPALVSRMPNERAIVTDSGILHGLDGDLFVGYRCNALAFFICFCSLTNCVLMRWCDRFCIYPSARDGFDPASILLRSCDVVRYASSVLCIFIEPQCWVVLDEVVDVVRLLSEVHRCPDSGAPLDRHYVPQERGRES